MTRAMTPERWAEVQDRLHEVLDAAEGERPVLLARIAARDPALAVEVRSLLDAEAHGPLGRERDSDLVAEYVGPFRLIRRLGEGGMGIVFLAEREEAGFRQRVALKLLRSGFLEARLAEQVTHERRVLARLEHPNIARLIDGGTTATGQPYLAMEYVDGDTLLEHASRRALALTERVRLFVEVCEAVHYAHQQLVVHRDLKPRNVMVGLDGRPRLLDFGISKLLDREEGEGGLTRSSPWLTAAYASPEQLRGRAVSTLSDVYALGMILYELLAGARPYDLDGRSPGEVERLVCEVEPPRPSERCADARTARGLRGDLDTIVLTALAKEPARRYPSAGQLAEDLRRYLAGRPVRARPDSLGYRAGKFVRRHRTGVAAGAVIAALLAAGVIAVARQAEIARRERDRAEEALARSQEVTQYLIGLFQAADPGRSSVPPEVAQALLRQGVEQAEELEGQPLVQASMLDALGMVFVNLNQFVEASDLVTRAWRLRAAALPADHPDLATSLSHLGRVRRGQSRYQESLQRYEEALAIRLRSQGPDHPDVAATYAELGFLAPYLGRNDDAVRYYEQALAIARRSLGEEHAQTAEYLGALGLALRRQGRLEEGLVMLKEAVARKARALGPDHPETARTMFHLGDHLVRLGRPAEAEPYYRDAIAIRRRVLGDEDLGLVHGLENLAAMLSARGEHAEAEALLREALRIRRRRLGERSVGYAGSVEVLSDQLAREGRLAEALALRRQGLAIRRETLGTSHTSVAGSLANLSALLERAGQLDEAERAAREALAIRLRLFGPEHALVGLSRIRLASVLRARGRLTEAQAMGAEGLEIIIATNPPGHPDLREAHAVMAGIYQALSRPGEAAFHRRQASDSAERPSGA